MSVYEVVARVIVCVVRLMLLFLMIVLGDIVGDMVYAWSVECFLSFCFNCRRSVNLCVECLFYCCYYTFYCGRC